MEIVQPKKFDKKEMKQTADLPVVRGGETFDRSVQWLVYKPQLHAVAPFPMNADGRANNRERTQSGFPK